MLKIEINSVDEEVFSRKGFSEKGCFNSHCKDACCRMGCDVDRESYELMLMHKDEIETMLGFGLDQCFEIDWSNQSDFLGNNSISSTLRNGTCPFHLSFGKGCLLWQMVIMDNLPRRMIPSTCRLYPLTWHNGVMQLVPDVEKTCNCLDSCNVGGKSLWETQQEAIEDIFFIKNEAAMRRR